MKDLKNLSLLIYIPVSCFMALLLYRLYKTFISPDNVGYKYEQVRGGLSEKEATKYSLELLSAMNKYGTDTDTIMAIYEKIKEVPESYKSVASKFGMQPYFWGVYDAILGTKKTLLGWLQSELKSEDFEKWQSIAL